jgi:very-short-patch-repair endonuclease
VSLRESTRPKTCWRSTWPPSELWWKAVTSPLAGKVGSSDLPRKRGRWRALGAPAKSKTSWGRAPDGGVPQATTTLYRAGLLTGWVVTETCSRHRVPVPKLETRIARDLRRGMNRTEWRVWIRLRGRQVEGAKFRRQHPIGPYFADFYCPASRLLVEVDGPFHSDDVPTAYDQRRTAWLEADGYHVIRFLASEVDDDLDTVVDGIRAAILEWASPSGASRHLPR